MFVLFSSSNIEEVLDQDVFTWKAQYSKSCFVKFSFLKQKTN